MKCVGSSVKRNDSDKTLRRAVTDIPTHASVFTKFVELASFLLYSDEFKFHKLFTTPSESTALNEFLNNSISPAVTL